MTDITDSTDDQPINHRYYQRADLDIIIIYINELISFCQDDCQIFPWWKYKPKINNTNN